MTAEDEWFNERPDGRVGLGPAPENPLRTWLDDHKRGPEGWNGDGSGAARPNVTYRTRSEYMTAGLLRNALNYADDGDRVEVHGRELRVWKQD